MIGHSLFCAPRTCVDNCLVIGNLGPVCVAVNEEMSRPGSADEMRGSGFRYFANFSVIIVRMEPVVHLPESA